MNRYALAITLLIPNLIHSMELAETKYTAPANILIHRKLVNDLYQSTHEMLLNFTINKQSAAHLVNVIDQMNSLKLAQPPVRETEVGFFILKKNDTASLAETFTKTLSFTVDYPTLSIFFSRVATYNNEIGNKAFVSPNAIQAGNYLKSLTINRIVTKNAKRNIDIPQQTINENIIPAPGSVGVREFLQLMHDIADILNDNPEDAQLSARLIYHNELNGKAPAVSE